MLFVSSLCLHSEVIFKISIVDNILKVAFWAAPSTLSSAYYKGKNIEFSENDYFLF